MKRVQWPLQKLMDVTVQKEQTLEAELAAQAAAIRDLDDQCTRRRERLARQLQDLGRQSLEQRLPRQEVFMRFSVNEEREIRKLQQAALQLRQERERTLAKYMKVRSSRQMLEKLREQFRLRMIKEQNQVEQRKLDDMAGASHIRRMLSAAAVKSQHEVMP